MLIAIDHGNEQIKTTNHIFTSGLDIRAKRPPMAKSIMEYKNKYYSLTDKRLKYQWDKTTDDNFFALTLFAIAKELDSITNRNLYGAQDIQLSVGLPPAHYSKLYERFEKYFIDREPLIRYVVDNMSYTIQITDAMAFPQGYSAAVTVFPRLKETKTYCVIEIGGITTDYMLLKNKIPDLEASDSLEFGMIKLYQKITSLIQGSFGMCIDTATIDEILMSQAEFAFEQEIITTIHKCAESHVDELILELRERGIDLRTTEALFAGGGALVLKEYIQNCKLVTQHIILDDIHANARGYKLLYEMSR